MSAVSGNSGKRQRGRPPAASEIVTTSKQYRKNSLSENASASTPMVALSIDEIINIIMNRLLTAEPCSLNDLCLLFPSTSKDKVQMVVDLLVLFGQIIQIRLKDNQKVASTSSSKAVYNSKSPNLYAVSNFVKSPLPVFDLNKISDVIDEKLKKIKAINTRNIELTVI